MKEGLHFAGLPQRIPAQCNSAVQIDLIPDGDNTLIRLTQDHVPPPGVVPVRRGWDDYLDRLQIAAAGGDPGPDPGGVPQPTQGA